jgi:hypothetical protein
LEKNVIVKVGLFEWENWGLEEGDEYHRSTLYKYENIRMKLTKECYGMGIGREVKKE